VNNEGKCCLKKLTRNWPELSSILDGTFSNNYPPCAYVRSSVYMLLCQYLLDLNIFYFFKFTHNIYKFKYNWIGLKAEKMHRNKLVIVRLRIMYTQIWQLLS